MANVSVLSPEFIISSRSASISFASAMLLGRSQASCQSPSLVKALLVQRHASLTAYCRFQMPNEDPESEADHSGSSLVHSARKYCRLLRVSLANLTVEPIIFLVYLGWAFGNTIQAPGLYRRYVLRDIPRRPYRTVLHIVF